jgi:predicted PurR-regulated permease PerM
MNVISFFMMLVLIPFFSFYFMRDYARIVAWLRDQIPPRHKDFVVNLFREIDDVLSHFIRGQMGVCLVMGTLYAVSLRLWGVEKGIAIGVITGILNIIPYVGLATGLVLSLSLSLLEFHGWVPVVGCLVTYSALPLLDNFFVTPRILGQSVGMNPVIIIVSLLVGGQLLGLVGLLIAVPAAAIIRVVGRMALESYRKSAIYQGDETSEK